MYDYCYINKTKVDSLFSQLNGSLIEEQKEHKQNGVKGVGKVGLEVGSILAKLGLAKATGDAEIIGDYSRLLEITSSLSAANKIDVIREYHSKQDSLSTVTMSHAADRDSVTKEIGKSELQQFDGRFKVTIDGVSDSEVPQTIMKVWRSSHPEDLSVPQNARLQSVVMTNNPSVSLVQVPIFLNNILQNQVFVGRATSPMHLLVLGNTIVSDDHFVVNPLAVSIKYGVSSS